MRTLLLLAILTGGCRRKHAPVETATPAAPVAQVVAPVAEVAAPAAVEEPVVQPPPAPPAETASGPTDVEIRARLKPLFPQIKRCITQAPKSLEPLGLRFTISPGDGALMMIELDGKPEAKPCVVEVLSELRFEPWSGVPSYVALPLTADGQPVLQFPDGGVK